MPPDSTDVPGKTQKKTNKIAREKSQEETEQLNKMFIIFGKVQIRFSS